MEHLEESFLPNLKPLFKTVIKGFNNTIVISNKQQAKPYIKGRKSPKLPIKYSSKIGVDYYWDENNKLRDIATKNIVASNASKAGLPKLWKVNFQDLYNGKIHKFSANAYIQKLKEYIMPYIEDNEFIKEEGLTLELRFFLEPKSNWIHNIDIDNLQSLWFKSVLDAMKGVIIRDDHPFLINSTKASVSFVEQSETRLEILLWKN